jgi:hypothetical protein
MTSSNLREYVMYERGIGNASIFAPPYERLMPNGAKIGEIMAPDKIFLAMYPDMKKMPLDQHIIMDNLKDI